MAQKVKKRDESELDAEHNYPGKKYLEDDNISWKLKSEKS